jgi:mono/diheme cytochrome c family protein
MLRVSVLVTFLFVVGITLSQAALLSVPKAEVAVTEVTVIEVTVTHAAVIERGLELYLANSCGVCHVSSKATTKGTFGPSHDGLSVIASARIQDPAYKGEATTAEDYIKESLLQPERYLVQPYGSSRYKMPAYVNLSEEDIAALTSFLLQP